MRYFDLRIEHHRSVELLATFQPSLEIKAELCSLAFLMPRPPCFLLLQTFSQLTRWTFLASSVLPQRKFLFNLSILSQILRGSSIVCIKWLGMAEVTALMRVVRPARDKFLAFHPDSLLDILSMISLV